MWNNKRGLFCWSLLVILIQFISINLYAANTPPGVPYIAWYEPITTQLTQSIRWDMWWGENGDKAKIFIDGNLIEKQNLSPNTPQAQFGNFQINLPIANQSQSQSFSLHVELCNQIGCTLSSIQHLDYVPQESESTSESTNQGNVLAPGIPQIAWHPSEISETSYDLRWDMWWGTNGDTVKLLVDNELKEQVSMTVASPSAQSGVFHLNLPLSDLNNTSTLKIELCNNVGCSESTTTQITFIGGENNPTNSEPTPGPTPQPTPNPTPGQAGLASCQNVIVGDVLEDTNDCLVAIKADDNFGGVLGQPQHSFEVIGYFAEWGVYSRNFHVADIPAAKVTRINYAFANLQTDGTVYIADNYAAFDKTYPTDTYAQGQNGIMKQLWLLKQKFSHIQTYLSIGGWTYSANFYHVAADPVKRQRFAQTAKSLAQQYGFDGIDIDWEFPVIGGLNNGSTSDRENYNLLMAQLRQELGQNYKLSVANSAAPRGIDAIDYQSFSSDLDGINLMSYDFNGAWNNFTGHSSALFHNSGQNPAIDPEFNISSSLRNVQTALGGNGQDHSKLIAGVAFYGRSWANVNGTPTAQNPSVSAQGAGIGSFEDGVVDYKHISGNYQSGDTITGNGPLAGRSYQYYWDEQAQAPFLYSSSLNEFISYTDSKAIYLQSCYVYHQNLGGVMFWEFSSDNGDLINAIDKALTATPLNNQVDCGQIPQSVPYGGQSGSSQEPGSGQNSGGPTPTITTVTDFIDETNFNMMFPNRNALFDYNSFVEAARYYPDFGGVGTLEVRKREIAAFLANIAHETTGGWGSYDLGSLRYQWGLYFKEEVGCESGLCTGYCDSTNPTYGYACGLGNTYHGRGPIQLSWNYNYGLMGEMLGLDLINDPGILTRDGVASFRSAIWFWMTTQLPKPSAHDVMTGQWTPSQQDIANGRLPGFGMTVNIINGGLECNMPHGDKTKDRVGFFQTFTGVFGVSTGPNLFCDQMQSY